MRLTMLGTGNAMVTECYNTCFVLERDGSCLLVDGGGGGAILARLRHAGYDWRDMRDIFVTHRHIDHLLGIVWMMRMICQHMREGSYEGEARIYGHDEVIALLRELADRLLTQKETRFIGERLMLIPVSDGERRTLIGNPVTFFDIGSTKARQFGFCMEYDGGKRLVCCGDEPYSPCEEKYARGCDWLMHEAFCLHSQADVFHPYEKHHSTAADAGRLAEELGAKSLILYHTEDSTLPDRRRLYTEECARYYSGSIYVPDDLETIEIR